MCDVGIGSTKFVIIIFYLFSLKYLGFLAIELMPEMFIILKMASFT